MFLTAAALVISGGIGNLIDRLVLGYVIDYIKFEPINFPVFNFADICIVIGGILFCIYFIIIDEIKKKKASPIALIIVSACLGMLVYGI